MTTPARTQTSNGHSVESGARTPPHAPDAERMLLGSIMIEGTSFHKVADLLDDGAFYRPAHAVIFRAMRGLAAAGDPVDITSTTEALRRENKLDEIGGSLYLSELLEQAVSAANVEYYAMLIYEKAILRRTMSISSEAIAHALDGVMSAEEVIDDVLSKLTRLSKDGTRKSIPAKQAAHDTVAYINKLKTTQGFVSGITSGFEKIDEYTAGFRSGELIIIAARPSMGKTSLAMNIAEAAAEKEGTGVAVFSLEMDVQQLMLRMLSSKAKIGLHQLRSNVNLKPQDWTRLVEAADDLSGLRMFFDDTAGITIESLRARSRQMAQEYNIGLIVIDYLQLIQPPRMPDNQQQWVAFVSAQLKHLAKDLHIPVICLSQLSRAPETRGGDRKPMLSDLRDSGAIEQDADVVMFVYRPEVYKDTMKAKQYEFNGKKYDFEGLAEIIVAKNRNGPTGSFLMTFLGKYTMFANFADDVVGRAAPSPGETGEGDESNEDDTPGDPF